jgi:UPF0716 protein FxsA
MLAELAVYVLLAGWIGVGWTILATLATSAVGGALLARRGTRVLSQLGETARRGEPTGRALGDAGLAALGGLLMILPGFLGDLVGLLCLLPGTRVLPRLLLGRILLSRLPDRLSGPVHVRSTRAGQFEPGRAGAPVIEGEIAEAR